MPRPKTHDEALRIRLLDRAGELLSAEGPHALSLRRLAKESGTSTTAVYSLYGGKQELLQALYVEAFHRFHARLSEAPVTDDAAEDVIALGLAYRESALANPHLYSIMFSRPVPDFTPDEAATAESVKAFEPLLSRVRRAVEEGRFVDEPAEQIALTCWGMVHGLVSLELNGNLPPAVSVPPIYERSLRALNDGWLRR